MARACALLEYLPKAAVDTKYLRLSSSFLPDLGRPFFPPFVPPTRYVLAVNVMTASVLRDLVETALADLVAFFKMYANTSEAPKIASSPNQTQTGQKLLMGSGGDICGHGAERLNLLVGSREEINYRSSVQAETSSIPQAFKVAWPCSDKFAGIFVEFAGIFYGG